jgi:acyl carrier protein phosphodiesterase
VNYLAHLNLSNSSAVSVLRRALGDFVNGPLELRFSDGIGQAIMFHWKIDSYTHAHSLVRASRGTESTARPGFADISIDMCDDRFVALRTASRKRSPRRPTG